MTNGLALYPFDSNLCIGTTIEVSYSAAKVNLPFGAASDALWHHGQRHGRGEVGDFVLIEVENTAVLGRIMSIRLPEKDRLSVESNLGGMADNHPVGIIQILVSLSIQDGKFVGGPTVYPRLGSRVFAIKPDVLEWIANQFQNSAPGASQVLQISIGALKNGENTKIIATPEKVFGRHCAVLGATGGGKSWTVARLIEQAAAAPGAKVILLDATGEFYKLSKNIRHVYLGQGNDEAENSVECVLPYQSLTEGDLFALFAPSTQTQAPKLRAAMKSLKLARVEPNLQSDGVIVKAQKSKEKYESAYKKHADYLGKQTADFDINNLSSQIEEECVYSTPFNSTNANEKTWGGYSQQDKGYCTTLISRIEAICSSAEFACIFRPENKPSLVEEIDHFLNSSSDRIFRISFKNVSFTNSAREVVANAIGRHLLAIAREYRFKHQPVVVFLDEAHQFLNKEIGLEEVTRYRLDAFELIAKEGRKYSLNICISTQRPRDIPEGVLSQMGTLIVHRLINDRDREIVEKASGELDRSAAAFLPSLAPGEAVLVGIEFPFPIVISIGRPQTAPDSLGPQYQKYWAMAPERPKRRGRVPRRRSDEVIDYEV